MIAKKQTYPLNCHVIVAWCLVALCFIEDGIMRGIMNGIIFVQNSFHSSHQFN